jgi:excinuclease ABC subunit C
LPDFDQLLAAAPESPAVFAIFAAEGEPYLAKTSNLKRRLTRLLGPNARLYSLRSVAERVEFELTASRLESNLVFYEWARRLAPANWRKRVKLPSPAFVKLILSNEYPRTQVTPRLSGGASRYYGPFRTRAQAELFEAKMLDLFQIRRCVEDLAPSPAHPGCIYGEMNLCLRPCQQAVTQDEYLGETERVRAFLESSGRDLLASIERARDRASEELEFEEAQRQHRRLEKTLEAIKLRDELSADLDQLAGVAVLPSSNPAEVMLRPFRAGWWLPLIAFPLDAAGQSMDARLRPILDALPVPRGSAADRQDHTALLAQWFYSTWRDGEWVEFPVSYRKLVRAINSVAAARSSATPEARPAGS